LIPALDPKLKILPYPTQSMGVIPDSTKREGLFITEKNHSIPTPPPQLAELETDSAPQQNISNLLSTNGLPLLSNNHEINSV
jgi:hypothetical protein